MQHMSCHSAYREAALGPNRPRAGNDEARGLGGGIPCTIGRINLCASRFLVAIITSWKALHFPRRFLLRAAAEPIFSSNSGILFQKSQISCHV